MTEPNTTAAEAPAASSDSPSTITEAAAPPAAETPAAAAPAPAAEPAAPPAAEPVADPKVAQRFAALARKEKELTLRAKEVDEKTKRVAEYEGIAGKFKQDPLAVLEHFGVGFQEVVDAVLKQGQPETPEDRIARIEKELADERQAKANAQTAAEQQETERKVTEFRTNMRAEIDASADKYELIVAEGAYDVVFEVLSEHFERFGEFLGVEKAADLVEDHLLERTKARLTTKKAKALFGAGAAPTPSPDAAKKQPGSALPPTLSNERTAEGVTPPPASPPANETHEQAIARIAARIKAQKAASAA